MDTKAKAFRRTCRNLVLKLWGQVSLVRPCGVRSADGVVAVGLEGIDTVLVLNNVDDLDRLQRAIAEALKHHRKEKQ